MQVKSIFDYIKTEETRYKLPVNIMDWEWSMCEHIKTSFYYKNGRLTTGNALDKPVKNITRPILNLQYRTEDIDVKDVFIYVDDPEKYHLSFLVKKYHDDVFVKEHDLDTLFDRLNQSRIDYGGGLLKDINQPIPEIVPLETIAFCDQTDLLSGSIGIRHYFSVDQLKEMGKKGWGDSKNGATATIDEVIVLSENVKKDKDGKETQTPSKYIEVYEVHGTFPETFEKDDGDPDKYTKQMHIVCFYKNQKDEREGITLFKGKTKDNFFKLTLRDYVHGRALGYGGAEELFENQVWVNYNQILIKQMLDSAAKMIYKTTDGSFASRNKINEMDNGEIAVLAENTDISQIDTFPRNLALFDKSTEQWEMHAQQMGAANDSIMGKSPSSGTPFALQELVVSQNQGLHDYRKGQYAKFLEEVYRDWIIPYIIKEITKGAEFLSNLDLDELQEVAERVASYEVNKIIIEKILNREEIFEGEVDELKNEFKLSFTADSKKFISILKDEFTDVPLAISINIAGKQKDLSGRVDKLVNVFRQILVNPQVLEQPQMAKLFNKILEASGISPIDFGGFKMPIAQPEMALTQQKNGTQ